MKRESAAIPSRNPDFYVAGLTNLLATLLLATGALGFGLSLGVLAIHYGAFL